MAVFDLAARLPMVSVGNTADRSVGSDPAAPVAGFTAVRHTKRSPRLVEFPHSVVTEFLQTSGPSGCVVQSFPLRDGENTQRSGPGVIGDPSQAGLATACASQ